MNNKNTSKTVFTLFCIFFLSLTVRLVVLAHTYDSDSLRCMTMGQGMLAYNLLQGNGYSSNYEVASWTKYCLNDISELKKYLIPIQQTFSAHETPGYATLLAGTWFLAGEERYIYLQIAQIIIDSLMVFVVFWIANKTTNITGVALIAATLFALFIPEARVSSMPLRDVWSTFTVILATAILIKSQECRTMRKRSLLYLALGIIFGLGTYLHPIVQYFGLFMGVGVFLKSGWRATLYYLVITHTVILLILSPWIMRNYDLFHKFIPTRDIFWHGVWEGWGEFPDNPMGAVMNDGITYNQSVSEGFRGLPGTSEYIEFLKQKSLKAIKEHPGWVAGAVIRRIPSVLFPTYAYFPATFSTEFLSKYSDFKVSASIEGFSQLFNNHPYETIKKIMLVTFGTVIRLLIPLFFVIGIIMIRKKLKDYVFLILVPLYFFAVLLPFHVEPRYLLPIFFSYFIFCAIPIYRAIILIKSQK